MKNKKILAGVVALVIIVAAIVIYNLNKVTYTKEFTYLPQYKSMQAQKYQKPKGNQFGNAIFKVEGVKSNDYFDNYKKILKKDGWTIVKENKPTYMEAKKDKHIAKINIMDAKSYLNILIWSK